MKITFFFLILFILSGRNSAQNFFPLQVGDVYQIKDVETWTGPGGTGGSDTYFKVNSVLNDSLINGETFYAVSLDEFWTISSWIFIQVRFFKSKIIG